MSAVSAHFLSTYNNKYCHSFCSVCNPLVNVHIFMPLDVLDLQYVATMHVLVHSLMGKWNPLNNFLETKKCSEEAGALELAFNLTRGRNALNVIFL